MPVRFHDGPTPYSMVPVVVTETGPVPAAAAAPTALKAPVAGLML